MTPTSLELHEILWLCKRLALEASALILDIYTSEIESTLKSDGSPLTLADRLANDHIVSGLQADYPDIPIMAEESAEDPRRLSSEWCFIVDPLDGTKEFLARNGEFTVNIGLVHQDQAVLGVIVLPAKQELYWGLKGDGAYFQDLATHDVKTLHVSDRVDQLIAIGSRSHAVPQESQLLEAHRSQIAQFTVAGSSLKGCKIASGEADLYYRFGNTMEWDVCAMQAIVEAAGGLVLDLHGQPLSYNHPVPRFNGFCVLNRKDNFWLK